MNTFSSQYKLIPKEQLFRKTKNGRGRTIADAKRQNYGFQPMSYLMYKSKQNQKFNYRKNSSSDNRVTPTLTNNLNSKSVNSLYKTSIIQTQNVHIKDSSSKQDASTNTTSQKNLFESSQNHAEIQNMIKSVKVKSQTPSRMLPKENSDRELIYTRCL